MDKEQAHPPIEVPLDRLSPEALQGLIESFILREGTDYGREEVSLEKKTEQIRRQLDRGEVKIIFDPDTETVTLLTKREWQKRTQNSP